MSIIFVIEEIPVYGTLIDSVQVSSSGIEYIQAKQAVSEGYSPNDTYGYAENTTYGYLEPIQLKR